MDRLREHPFLFEQHPQAMWIYDTSTLRILAANDAALEQYGYTRDEFLSLTLPDFRPTDDVAALHELVRSAPLRGRRSARGRHVRKDGTFLDVEVQSSALEGLGVPARIVVVQDVSSAVKSAEALQAAEARYQYILSAIPAVLYMLTIRGGLVCPEWVSGNIQPLLGYSPHEGLDPGWWTRHVHPDDIERTAIDLTQLRATKHLLREYRFRAKHSEYRWIRDEQRVVRDTGDIVEVVGAWVDITDYRRLQDQFQHAQKMEAVGQLAGGIAHDFNNLLTVIRSYTELVMNALPPGDPTRADVDEVMRASDQASRLTRQLLAFSRQQVLQPTALDINELVRGLTQMIERMIGEDIEVVLSLDERAYIVRADPGQIEQVLMNFAVNSRDAMPDGGVLRIATEARTFDETNVNTKNAVPPGLYTVLSVTDTGMGMAPEVQSRIFEPFFTTKEVGKGTGLGLATVYGIVKQSDGHIWVYSEPGRGTTFSVCLPAYEPMAEAASEARSAGVPRRGTETILLVEDDVAIRTLSRTTLVRQGYTVIDAANGIEALERVRMYPHDIHLLVTDVVMPRLGGIELATTLRHSRPDLRVIYTSGYPGRTLTLEDQRDLRVTFLAKPFTPRMLLETVERVL